MAERIDWRALPPVQPSEQPEVPDHPSQTFLKHHDRCDRAAMLYLRHRAGAGSHELNRGAIVHDVIARLTKQIMTQGENKIPVEVGKDELLAYMDENPELQVSAIERDACRYMIANWCAGSYFEPERIIACETTLQLRVGRFVIVCRVDLAEDLGSMIEVTDYKTSFNMPDAESFKPESFDERGDPRFAGDFQTMIYALAMAEGTLDDGMPLGGSYDRFRLTLRFPRYLRPEGLAYKQATVTRQQLTDFRFDVEHQLRRLEEVNIGERRWQPTPGTHCRECPAEYECPLPRILRPESQHAELDSLDDLEKAATSAQFMARRASNLRGRVKTAALRLEEAQPGVLNLPGGERGVYCGTDEAFLFIPTDHEEIRDKAKMREAIEGTVEYGHPFNWAEHVAYRQGTRFEKRKVPPRRQRGDTDGG